MAFVYDAIDSTLGSSFESSIRIFPTSPMARSGRNNQIQQVIAVMKVCEDMDESFKRVFRRSAFQQFSFDDIDGVLGVPSAPSTLLTLPGSRIMFSMAVLSTAQRGRPGASRQQPSGDRPHGWSQPEHGQQAPARPRIGLRCDAGRAAGQPPLQADSGRRDLELRRHEERQRAEPTAVALASQMPARAATPSFAGGIVASAGRESLGSSRVADVAGAGVDLRGSIGRLRVELAGDVRNVAAAYGGSEPAAAFEGFSGRAAAFRVGLSSAAAGRLGISGQTRELLLDRGQDPVDVSQFQVRYVLSLGDERSTDIQAQYFSESGFLRGGALAPERLPDASRIWTIQGGYAQGLGEKSRLRTGLRYREASRLSVGMEDPSARPAEYLDLWAHGETDLDSALVVQYGLGSTLHDGEASLLPRAGLLLRFSPSWQASIAGSRRVVATERDPLADDFTPQLLESVLACVDFDSSCYEIELVRSAGGSSHFKLRGSMRQFDRTVRVFLQDDHHASGEGVFFVPGDRLPEIHGSWSKRLGRSFVANWRASYADGGGGAYLAADRNEYENRVAYLSTSFDTTFEPTATAVLLAFQRVAQRIDRLERVANAAPARNSAELERLELAVSQDLSALFDLASTWAVRVGMEVVRGGTLLLPVVDGDDLRRRLTTSVAVRF
jgi:hypothetical protein